ncbi:MAG: hypothetical protein WDN69_18060 [Aliidongia sp.]
MLGLDNRPAAKAHFRRRAAAATSYTPLQIAQFYDFPTGTGKGQCVAIIELGGGEKAADLKTYFSGLGISPEPKVTVVSVDKAKNKPTGSADGPDGEVMLDIEVVGAIAPQAHIVVYSRPIPMPASSTRSPRRSTTRPTSPRSSRSAGAARNPPGPSNR